MEKILNLHLFIKREDLPACACHRHVDRGDLDEMLVG